MNPQDVIAQLFGPQSQVNDVDGEHIYVDNPQYQGVTFLNVDVDWSTGIATLFDQAGCEALKLAIKAELVPITEE